jgi:hypothetical protein
VAVAQTLHTFLGSWHGSARLIWCRTGCQLETLQLIPTVGSRTGGCPTISWLVAMCGERSRGQVVDWVRCASSCALCHIALSAATTNDPKTCTYRCAVILVSALFGRQLPSARMCCIPRPARLCQFREPTCGIIDLLMQCSERHQPEHCPTSPVWPVQSRPSANPCCRRCSAAVAAGN